MAIKKKTHNLMEMNWLPTHSITLSNKKVAPFQGFGQFFILHHKIPGIQLILMKLPVRGSVLVQILMHAKYAHGAQRE